MIRTILFATDFSPCARSAERFAVVLAKTFRASIHVLHVTPQRKFSPVDEPDAAREGLQAVAARLAECAVAGEPHEVAGPPADRIIATAEETHADVIVIGTHGRAWTDYLKPGGIAERVMTEAPSPVASVCPLDRREPDDEERKKGSEALRLERLLVPIDFSDCSQYALLYSVEMARRLHLELVLLHVLDWTWIGLQTKVTTRSEMQRVHGQVESAILGAVRDMRAEGLRVQFAITDGNPEDEIIDMSRDKQASLIVMGTHGRQGLKRVLLGSVARSVVVRASCPVLTINSRARRSSEIFAEPFRLGAGVA